MGLLGLARTPPPFAPASPACPITPIDRQNRSDTNASTAASSVVVFPGRLAVVRSARRAVRFPALRPPLRSRLRSPGSGTVRRSRADVVSLRSATSRFAVTTLPPPLRSDHSPPDFTTLHSRCALPVGGSTPSKHHHSRRQAPAEQAGKCADIAPLVRCPHFWRPITGNNHPGRNSKAPLPVSHIPNTNSRPVSKQADFARAHRSFRSGGRGHCRE